MIPVVETVSVPRKYLLLMVTASADVPKTTFSRSCVQPPPCVMSTVSMSDWPCPVMTTGTAVSSDESAS